MAKIQVHSSFRKCITYTYTSVSTYSHAHIHVHLYSDVLESLEGILPPVVAITWVVVKTMVPFWIPLWHPKRDHNFDVHRHVHALNSSVRLQQFAYPETRSVSHKST